MGKTNDYRILNKKLWSFNKIKSSIMCPCHYLQKLRFCDIKKIVNGFKKSQISYFINELVTKG